MHRHCKKPTGAPYTCSTKVHTCSAKIHTHRCGGTARYLPAPHTLAAQRRTLAAQNTHAPVRGTASYTTHIFFMANTCNMFFASCSSRAHAPRKHDRQPGLTLICTRKIAAAPPPRSRVVTPLCRSQKNVDSPIRPYELQTYRSSRARSGPRPNRRSPPPLAIT